MAARSAAEAAKGRAALAGMSTLSDLSELKLEQEGKAARVAGEWKEYVKADGRVWYYNTNDGKQTWIKPDVFVKLDEVQAAAAAANSARGT